MQVLAGTKMPRSATWRPEGPCEVGIGQRRGCQTAPEYTWGANKQSRQRDLFGASLEASSKRGAKIRKVGGPLMHPPRQKMRYLHLYLALIPVMEIPFFCGHAITPGRLFPLPVKGVSFSNYAFFCL